MNIGPFLGMNNLAEDHALPRTEGGLSAVRNAINVDFDNAGKMTRRDGCTKKLAGINMKYGFSCGQGMFTIDAGVLYKINTTSWTKTAIAYGLTGSTFTTCDSNSIVYLSDTTKTFRIKDSVATSWGMGIPPAPVVTRGAGLFAGLFGAGVYLCALTYIDDDGNESGASALTAITLTVNSSITFYALPSSTDAKVTGVVVYLSTANGDVLYKCAKVSAGTSSYQVVLGHDKGKRLSTMFLAAPPAGQIIREFNGRIGVATGNLLRFTKPYSPDLMDYGNEVIQYPSDITVFEPVVDGVWVVADKTYFLAGSGPHDFQQIDIPSLECGAALGTGQKIPDTKLVTWCSHQGVVIAGNGGEIKNIQEANVAPDYSDSGAMVIKEYDGIKHAIAVLVDPTMSKRANRNFIEAETIRRA